MQARELTLALGGEWRNGRGMGPCPVPGHGKGRGDLNWSLSIRAGERQDLLVHCFAGCDPIDVLAALRNLDPVASTKHWIPGTPVAQRLNPCAVGRSSALDLWSKGLLIEGTPAERYLRRRGLAAPGSGLRYLPDAFHTPTGQTFPAMIAALENVDGAVIAIQRTFLTSEGEKAPVEPVRMTLGSLQSATVRLAPEAEMLGLAEGVETALAATHLSGIPCWAACGARLHNIALPACARKVILFADHDAAGLQTATRAAIRFHEEGRTADVRTPEIPGADWNDIALARGRTPAQ